MAKPQLPIAENFPILQPTEVTFSFEGNGKIYARLTTATDQNGLAYSIRERSGLEVEKYQEKPIECVSEIVKARFFKIEELKENKQKPPADAIQGTFIGWNTGYKFFQELVSMVDGETGDADDDDFDEDEYDVLATELFAKWGISGFGLDVYRDKPMIKTENGVFFLNEFIFEEQIDEWEESMLPNVPVCFEIEELLLHGFKIFEGEWKKKEEKKEIVAKPHEQIIVGRPRTLERGRKWYEDLF